jgi:hypothetical protein
VGWVLMVSPILFLPGRDPEGNVAVVDGLIVGLVVLAVTPWFRSIPWTCSGCILGS